MSCCIGGIDKIQQHEIFLYASMRPRQMSSFLVVLVAFSISPAIDVKYGIITGERGTEVTSNKIIHLHSSLNTGSAWGPVLATVLSRAICSSY